MARGQNLLSKVYNKPLLITHTDLQPIADYLSNPERAASLRFDTVVENTPKLADFNSEDLYRKAVLQYYDINPDTMTGVLNIDGVLVNKEGQMNAQCVELTSYQGLKKRFEAQVSQGMRSCVLMISSGGGECFGAWSTANYIKKVAKENNIKLTAFANGSACSAAYVWAVVADEIVSHPLSSVGSIGVLVQLYNDSKYLENVGVTRSFVYAGGNKIPFDKNGDFTDKFISDLQKSVDNTYSKFVQHVVNNRNMSKQEVIDTQASVFDVEEAIELGLIDRVMELEDFEIEYGLKTKTQATGNGTFLQTEEQPVENKQLKHNKETQTMSEQNVQEQVASVEELTAQLATATIDKQSLEAQVAKLQGDLSKVQSDLSASVLAKEHAEAELTKFKADAAHNARVEQLAAVFGTESEKPQMYATMFASLDAEAFGKVVSDFQASVKTQEQSMEEVGHSASASAIAETPEEMLLKQAQARKAKQKA